MINDKVDGGCFSVPSAPRDVEVIQVNASTVKVSWQRPAHSNGVLIGYYVYKEQLINGEPVSDQLQRAMVIHDPDVCFTSCFCFCDGLFWAILRGRHSEVFCATDRKKLILPGVSNVTDEGIQASFMRDPY